jgi:hypothetical protein
MTGLNYIRKEVEIRLNLDYVSCRKKGKAIPVTGREGP